MAGPLIELSGTTNDLSGLSGGPSYGQCSGMRPALPFGGEGGDRVSENLRLGDSGSDLTWHER